MFKRAFHRDAILVIGLYNIVVGVLVFFLYERVFILFDLRAYTPARPPAIQIPCLFLVVFGIGYALAHQDLVRNRVILFVGLLQNVAVTGAVIYYQISAPKLVHPVYYLPAALGALFAAFFLMAWFGALVDARRQRRQERRLIIKPAPRPAETAPEPKHAEAPAPVEEEPPPEKAVEVHEKRESAQPPHPAEPEPREPQTPTDPGQPDEELPLRPLAHRDRSGIPPD